MINEVKPRHGHSGFSARMPPSNYLETERGSACPDQQMRFRQSLATRKSSIVNSPPMSFLQVNNLSKSFSGVPVLQDINLGIEKGEFVAIVGFSGAGKTTLISLIAGLIRPDAGALTLNDLEITAPGPENP